MALGLVGRSARALSDHLNLYYRVLKGVDPDSVVLRLPAAGAFEVRHSVTAAPILRVIDNGIEGVITGSNLADGSVTSAKIANGTIVNQDIADNTITSAKLASGVSVPAHSIGTNELVAGAVHQQWNAGAIPTTGSNQTTSGAWYDLPGAQLAISGLTVGSLVLVAYAMPLQHSAPNGRNAVRVARLDTGAAIGQAGGFVGGPAATPVLHAGCQYFVPNVAALTLSVQAFMVDAGSSQSSANSGSLVVVEIRP